MAVILGVLTARIVPEWWGRSFATFQQLFGNFLSMFVPILILGLVAAGISELKHGAGKLLVFTILLAYISSVGTGLFAFVVSDHAFPSIISMNGFDVGQLSGSDKFIPYFSIEMPAFLDVTTALVVAFIFGTLSTSIKGHVLRDVIGEIRDIVMLVISKIIIPLLPIYVYCVFLSIGRQDSIGPLFSVFAKGIGIIFAVHVFVLVVQFAVAGAIAKRNPFKTLWNMMPAYVTALATSSSAATIPVTLACTKKNGVSNGVSEFCIPLCATIHMPCSMIKIVSFSYILCMIFGIPINTADFVEFTFMMSITAVAAPGIPGGVVMAALGLLHSQFGFGTDAQALIVALYALIDCFGTAGNITGDCALSMIVDTVYNKRS